jgi:hypothetical protein
LIFPALADLRILSNLTLVSKLSIVTHMTQADDTELAATVDRLRREHEHLEISAEVLIERRVFVARGRAGGHPWLVLSSDLARFERALAAVGPG